MPRPLFTATATVCASHWEATGVQTLVTTDVTHHGAAPEMLR